MGSKSSSYVDNSYHSNDNYDQKNTQGGLVASVGDGNQYTINQLDGGAVKNSLDLARDVYSQSADLSKLNMETNADTYSRLVGGLFDWSKNVNNTAQGVVEQTRLAQEKSQDSVANAYMTANGKQQALNMNNIIIVGLVVFGVVFYLKSKK